MRLGWVAAAAALSVSACMPEAARAPSGKALYADFCAACHGASGKGDGPAAAGLAKRPADLTGIAVRNGGVFPTVRVMSTIDGYTRRGDGTTIMPELGLALKDSPPVRYDPGDGNAVPTPSALVALAEYLRSIQR
ncbi:MAG: c-type cytochrome [Paracoccaceae bacterium]